MLIWGWEAIISRLYSRLNSGFFFEPVQLYLVLPDFSVERFDKGILIIIPFSLPGAAGKAPAL